MSPRIVRLRSAAKINLTLEVGARRADGYHELRSVVQTVGLWDTLELERTEGEVALSCNWAGLESEQNLCVRAAHRLREICGVRAGCRITLTKTIPTGAGLGGGSGNAAATLVGLAHLWKLAVEHDTLHALAKSLGADVPLFLVGGSLLMEGIGERITPLGEGPRWHSVIIKPRVSVSTTWAYERLEGTKRVAPADHDTMIAALRAGDLHACAQVLRNDMEEAVLVEYSDVDRAKQALREAGARGALMSGSGSAVFGLFASAEEAQQAASKIAGCGETLVAPFAGAGYRMD